MSEDHDLYRMVGEISGKLDALISASEARDGRYDKHDKRLSGLEATGNKRIGRERTIFAALAGVSSLVGWPHIKEFFGGS